MWKVFCIIGQAPDSVIAACIPTKCYLASINKLCMNIIRKGIQNLVWIHDVSITSFFFYISPAAMHSHNNINKPFNAILSNGCNAEHSVVWILWHCIIASIHILWHIKESGFSTSYLNMFNRGCLDSSCSPFLRTSFMLALELSFHQIERQDCQFNAKLPFVFHLFTLCSRQAQLHHMWWWGRCYSWLSLYALCNRIKLIIYVEHFIKAYAIK